MKLLELKPYFLKIVNESMYDIIDDIKNADGISFICPECKREGNRQHSVMCWQPHVPQSFSPKPGRWNFLGTGLNDLELQNGSSSILLNGGCNAHFWIRNGEIIFC